MVSDWRIVGACLVQFLLCLGCNFLLQLDFTSKLLGLSQGLDGQPIVKDAALGLLQHIQDTLLDIYLSSLEVEIRLDQLLTLLVE